MSLVHFSVVFDTVPSGILLLFKGLKGNDNHPTLKLLINCFSWQTKKKKEKKQKKTFSTRHKYNRCLIILDPICWKIFVGKEFGYCYMWQVAPSKKRGKRRTQAGKMRVQEHLAGLRLFSVYSALYCQVWMCVTFIAFMYFRPASLLRWKRLVVGRKVGRRTRYFKVSTYSC